MSRRHPKHGVSRGVPAAPAADGALAVPHTGNRPPCSDPQAPRRDHRNHLQALQFECERESKMRQVRLCGPSPVAGEPARMAMSGVEVEVVIVAVVPGLLTVKVKRTAAKVTSSSRGQKHK